MLETAGGVGIGLIAFWLFIGLVGHIIDDDKRNFVRNIPSIFLGPLRFFV
jgi:hypothetical protein